MGDASLDFDYWEFACKCGRCEFRSGRHIDPRIITLTQAIRTTLGRPLSVNSGCRCETHNENEKGSPNSQHLPKNGFCAVDLGIQRWERRKAMQIALALGASVGINDDFMHFDFRDTSPENDRPIFLY